MDKVKRDLSVVYVCDSCSVMISPYTHCGRAMNLVTMEGTVEWLCWKGDHPPCCGMDARISVDTCCDSPNYTLNLRHVLT
ncbi:MAG: hypothetical protein ACXAB7_10690 [Candidatus Kariarchaeaceae archaeon]|jgi:hypothetical protein